MGGLIVLGGVTAFVGGEGGEEEELVDSEAASAGSLVGRLTEVSWPGLPLLLLLPPNIFRLLRHFSTKLQRLSTAIKECEFICCGEI